MVHRRRALITIVLLIVLAVLLPAGASAHNVSKRDAAFVKSTRGAAIAPFVYLGAKHMVTGYDHLLFLVGVIFFLYRLKDVVAYVSLFTIGHSVTLLRTMTTIEQRNVALAKPPSMAKIIAATGIALIGAVMILLLFVLPAEYGIDPLGSGKALGLTDLVRVAEKPTPGSVDASIVPVLVPSSTRGGAPTVRGTFVAQPNRFQFDSRELTLARGEGLEIKCHMTKGAGMVYSWTASGALSFEFHGEPNVKPAGEGIDYFESYELEDKGRTEGNGTFLAPSTGIHRVSIQTSETTDDSSEPSRKPLSRLSLLNRVI